MISCIPHILLFTLTVQQQPNFHLGVRLNHPNQSRNLLLCLSIHWYEKAEVVRCSTASSTGPILLFPVKAFLSLGIRTQNQYTQSCEKGSRNSARNNSERSSFTLCQPLDSLTINASYQRNTTTLVFLHWWLIQRLEPHFREHYHSTTKNCHQLVK